QKGAKVQLAPGDICLARFKLLPLPKQSHPEAFNYGDFLLKRGFRGQMQISEALVFAKADGALNAIKNFRKGLAENIELWPWSASEKALFKALFLGIKSGISKELKGAFQGAGIMHLLAVSGLHLGIIYLLLNSFTKFLRAFPGGRFWQFAILLLGIWSFVFLTGAGASVLRAATMFTFMGFGQLLRRKTNGLRPVLASALFLLWFKPLLIHDLGFQLSYAAVIGILVLLPIFNAFHLSKNRILKNLQQIVYVSLSAQIFTAPLSLYYFEQFPSYFLIANLLILPIMPLLMYGGLALLLIDQFFIADRLKEIYLYLLKLIEFIGRFVADLPGALLEISISQYQATSLCVLYLLLILFRKLDFQKRLKLIAAYWILFSLGSLGFKTFDQAYFILYGNTKIKLDFVWQGQIYTDIKKASPTNFQEQYFLEETEAGLLRLDSKFLDGPAYIGSFSAKSKIPEDARYLIQRTDRPSEQLKTKVTNGELKILWLDEGFVKLP
ncbi:MAG: ComEC/Rec2 family competence protein, partial [Croceimicrobium sp.]